MSERDEPRRLRRAYITPNAVLGLFNARLIPDLNGELSWSVPSFRDLPADVNAVAVCFDDRRQAFSVVLEHPSFEPVEPCKEIPEIDVRIDTVCLPVRRPELGN